MKVQITIDMATGEITDVNYDAISTINTLSGDTWIATFDKGSSSRYYLDQIYQVGTTLDEILDENRTKLIYNPAV